MPKVSDLPESRAPAGSRDNLIVRTEKTMTLCRKRKTPISTGLAFYSIRSVLNPCLLIQSPQE
jgi:hypothetical protein